MRTIILSLGFLMVLTSCSSGGSSLPSGSQCPSEKTYDPIPMKILPFQVEYSLDNNEAGPLAKMPTGTYKYERSDLYFVASDKDKPLSMYVMDILQANRADYKQSIACIRNARRTMNDFSVSVRAVTDVCVDDQKQLTTTREIGFRFTGSRPFVDKPTICAGCLSAPKDLFKAAPPTEYFMIRRAANDFEIRARYVTPQGTYILAVHMTYTAKPCSTEKP